MATSAMFFIADVEGRVGTLLLFLSNCSTMQGHFLWDKDVTLIWKIVIPLPLFFGTLLLLLQSQDNTG